MSIERAEKGNDYYILSDLINPKYTPHSILKYFDNPEHIKEFESFLTKGRELVKKSEVPCDVMGAQIREAITTLKVYNQEPSNVLMKELKRLNIY